MPMKVNPAMLRGGYVPATRVAEALGKALSTVHRMVDDGELEGMKDGGVRYVTFASLWKRYAGTPMAAVVKRLG